MLPERGAPFVFCRLFILIVTFTFNGDNVIMNKNLNIWNEKSSGELIMKKIAFFTRDFGVGGIQRALVSILDNLDYNRYKVDVYYCSNNMFYQLPQHENLNFIYFKPFPYFTRFVPFGILKAVGRFPFSNEEYDVAVEFNSYSSECAAAALAVKAKKRVMWVHNDVKIKYSEEPKYRILWNCFKGKFKFFDEFCAVSPGIIPSFREMTGLKDVKISSIQNFVDTDLIFSQAEEETDFTVDSGVYNVCSVGRLCRQKGYDILLDDMAQVVKNRQDIHLYLIGDGPDRNDLEQQIDRLGLNEYVSFLGNQKNPFPYVKQMDGFALTSRYEGQGIVLWEAKSLGLELFMGKNLEKYNPGLTGTEDIVKALSQAKKKAKVYDDLSGYNNNIKEQLQNLLG